MVVQGEDVRFGDHPQARAVNDLDLTGLLEALQKLHAGKDLAGIELKGTPRFSVGSTLDTGASGGLLNIELENLKKMLDEDLISKDDYEKKKEEILSKM